MNLSECRILNTITPPHGDAALLIDLDGDGHNELCIASNQGYLNIFKSNSNESTPWASGYAQGEIVLLSFGLFLKETLKPLLVVVTASCALLVKTEESETSPPELIFSGQHSPRNVSAGVTLPDIEDICMDVLVVGTCDGDLHIIRFDNVMPIETLSHGNMNDLEHVKHFEQGISSLASVKTNGEVMLVVGLVDGSFEVLKWPSLQSCHSVVPESVHSDIIRKDAKCVNVDQTRFCVSTLSGDLTLCELTNGSTSELLKYSLGVDLEVDEPLIGISQVPPLKLPKGKSLKEMPSFFAVTSCSGKTVMVECGRDLLSSDDPRAVSSCLFDPAPLFTAPLKAFVSGGYRAGKKNTGETSTTAVEGIDNQDEPCLIYVLGNGEVLVFHSLVSQIGDEIKPLGLLERLEKDLPGSLSKLRDIELFDHLPAQTGALSPEALRLRKILYCPIDKLRELKKEDKVEGVGKVLQEMEPTVEPTPVSSEATESIKDKETAVIET